MSVAPPLDIGRLPEGQNGGAKMMDVVPGLTWRVRKVNEQPGLHRNTFHDINLHRFLFASYPRMYGQFALY